MRRGFTMLELALAGALATIVAGATLVVFQSIDRADRRLANRFDRSVEVEQTRRAFQNAFASLATSERPRPRTAGDGAGQPASGTQGGGSRSNQVTGVDAAAAEKLARMRGGSGGGSGGSGGEDGGGDSVAPPPPPRLLLTPDTGSDSDPLIAAIGGQRLELVLSSSPVPVVRREEAEQARMELAEKAGDDARVNPSQEGGARAIRGVFTLRPQAGPPSKDVKAELLDTPMTELWWTPLPPAQDDPSAPALPLSLAAGYPVRLCSDVTRCTWRMYKGGEWLEQHSAVWRDDLPAYAEVQIDFGNGSSYKWLMEIDYTAMAEVTSAELDGDAAKKAGRDGETRGGTRTSGTRVDTTGSSSIRGRTPGSRSQ